MKKIIEEYLKFCKSKEGYLTWKKYYLSGDFASWIHELECQKIDFEMFLNWLNKNGGNKYGKK